MKLSEQWDTETSRANDILQEFYSVLKELL